MPTYRVMDTDGQLLPGMTDADLPPALANEDAAVKAYGRPRSSVNARRHG